MCAWSLASGVCNGNVCHNQYILTCMHCISQQTKSMVLALQLKRFNSTLQPLALIEHRSWIWNNNNYSNNFLSRRNSSAMFYYMQYFVSENVCPCACRKRRLNKRYKVSLYRQLIVRVPSYMQWGTWVWTVVH